eukprot:TRINITY_DN15999_c0_g2_i1.p1 TRINITY_DN15999_c0_g2~~TRINITY_DN15999_c0_g2_i1.p1  ORF type:complete len:153 (+),score=43.52 TRINITY_DN15999_c0_g2_i1:126-584(+)
MCIRDSINAEYGEAQLKALAARLAAATARVEAANKVFMSNQLSVAAGEKTIEATTSQNIRRAHEEELDGTKKDRDNAKVALEKAQKTRDAISKMYEELKRSLASGRSADCMDQKKYKHLCTLKKDLCKDKDFGVTVTNQCPETCNAKRCMNQ